MRIGLTYDLRQDYLDLGYSSEETAEFDAPETISGIEEALGYHGWETERIGNVWDLTRRLAAGDRWDIVFNIAEGLSGYAREAQVPALLEAWGIPCTFSDPLTLCLALDKAMAKRVAAAAGVPTAAFVEAGSVEELHAVDLPFPLFLKPVAEGTSKGVGPRSRVVDRAGLLSVGEELLRTFRQGVLVERFLPGREFTVGITGTGAAAEVIGVMEVIPTGDLSTFAYGYDYKQSWTEATKYAIREDAEARAAAEVALSSWRALRVRDGGRVDVRSDAEGRPHFIEVNPLSGLRPGYSDLAILAEYAGMSYEDLIGRIMRSALTRVPGPGIRRGRS